MRRGLTALPVSLAILLVGAAAAGAQEITTQNVSRYVGKDRWAWTVFVKASSTVLREIRCVEYTLHPTFPDPVRRVCELGNPAQPFALQSEGWGTFTIGVRVLFRNGNTRVLRHELKFAAPSIERALPIRTANTARRVSDDWWVWTIYIEGPAESLEQVRCVEYTLHPTFSDPVREVCDRGPGPAFALSARGGGTFTIRVRVFLKSGAVQELTHELRFGR
jgi:transcription initiation factor IIF auxiliary subunit